MLRVDEALVIKHGCWACTQVQCEDTYNSRLLQLGIYSWYSLLFHLFHLHFHLFFVVFSLSSLFSAMLPTLHTITLDAYTFFMTHCPKICPLVLPMLPLLSPLTCSSHMFFLLSCYTAWSVCNPLQYINPSCYRDCINQISLAAHTQVQCEDMQSSRGSIGSHGDGSGVTT